MRIRIIVGMGLMFAAAMGVSKATAQTATSGGDLKTVAPGMLTIAFTTSRPRVAGDDASLSGPFGLMVNEFAKRFGLKVKPFPTDFAATILAVSQGRADMGGVAYYSDQRAKVVRFVYPDVFDVSRVMVRPDFNYTGPGSIKKLAVPRGFTQVPLFEAALGKENVLTFAAYGDGVQALRNGQVDAYFVTNFGVPLAAEAGMKLVELKSGDFGILKDDIASPMGAFVSCKNQALFDAWNNFYREFYQSSSYKAEFNGAWSALGVKDSTNLIPEPKDPPKNQCS